MDLYARVNILDRKAVRLPTGDITDAIALDADPVERARGWVAKGADRLHIVDLDAAAYGDYENRPLIEQMIVKTRPIAPAQSFKKVNALITLIDLPGGKRARLAV